MTAIVSAAHDELPAQVWYSRILPYWLLAPAVLATLIVVFLPMGEAIVTSLYDFILWKPNASRFVGLGNYLKLLHDPVFWISAGHTAIWIGLTVPLQMGLGLVAALLLNREFPWRGLARALIVIPWALPSVVIALVWRWIYDPTTGILNELLLRLHIIEAAVPWLADPDRGCHRRRRCMAAIPPRHLARNFGDPRDRRVAAHHLGRQFGRCHLRNDRWRARLCDLHPAALCIHQGAAEP